MNENRDLGANALLPALKSDIDAFVDGASQFDDITMLASILNRQRQAYKG